MFFSQALLWRKGPVANIWTAAYRFKKLKREQIAQTDIASSVDQIINDIEISYRILAHLLFGIVRIFSKKVEFLEEDCNKTLKTLTESFRAIYWTNPKKTKHVRKQTAHLLETSGGGTHTGTELLEALRAHSDQVVISVPARFELDLFDLEIADNCDAPDIHQQSGLHGNTLDESDSDFFRHETYLKESGCRIFSSTCFTLIQDVIPVDMMIDLDLDITELYDSTSGEREKTALNANPNASAEQHQESIQNLSMEDSNGEAEAVEPSVRCYESPLKDINPNANASAEQHQESIQNLHAEDTSGEAKAVEPSVVCHESPLKDLNVPSKEKEDVPFLKNMQMKEPLNLADLPTTDPGLFSPKPMVWTPAKREVSGNSKKRKISWCCDQRTILSNEVMRNAIHDPSDLVYKRRKTPRTCLEAWRVERFNSVDRLFTEPLIPCTFSKVHAGASDYTPNRPNNRDSELEKPLNMPYENFTDVSNVGASALEQSKTYHTESEVLESLSEKFVGASDKGTSWFKKIRRRLFEPGTPENEPHGRSSDLSDWVHGGSEDPSGFRSPPDEPTPRILTETSDTTLSFLDNDLGSDDGDRDVDQTQAGTVWSACTRYVAHHLHKKASDLKRRNQESCLSLEQMLQGKKRKTCARFFYETLMLKGCGMIDVKQESPYGEIKIAATLQLDEFRES